MSNKTRVMICDDSAVMRSILTKVLTFEDDLHIVYQAEHGRDAIDHLDAARPDIIIVDVEMPVMNGIETVRSIRRRTRTLPIVMFSSLTSKGADATFEALIAGANDFATKPAGQVQVSDAVDTVRRDLIAKIRCLTQQTRIPAPAPQPAEQPARTATPPATPAAPNETPPTAPSARTPSSQTRRPALGTPARQPVSKPPARSERRISAPRIEKKEAPKKRERGSTRRQKPAQIVAIASSTGGPKALNAVLTRLPADFPAPVVIVQHMPRVFTAQLAERLNASCRLHVREGFHDAVIKPGEVWIAPGDFHMEIARVGTQLRLKINQDPPENAVRPAADPLFRTVAKCFGDAALGVVLTGMGKDGLAGAQALQDLGARVIVQDEATCAVWGMPRVVEEAGLADAVYPIDQIGFEITNRVRPVASGQPAVAHST
jgi:two-component system chemotaxis response regulator CheB